MIFGKGDGCLTLLKGVFGLSETQNCSMSARDAGPNLVTIQDGFVEVQGIKTTSGLIEVKSIWFRKSFHF